MLVKEVERSTPWTPFPGVSFQKSPPAAPFIPQVFKTEDHPAAHQGPGPGWCLESLMVGGPCVLNPELPFLTMTVG